jgi:hypothetical protein
MIKMKHILMFTLAVCAFALLDTPQAAAQITYTTKMTSGPFLVDPSALSVDWEVLNNDTEPVDICVTVYQLNISAAKTVVAPGPVCLTLEPGYMTHNANSVGSIFQVGLSYEVVVEATSDDVYPNVNQWSGFSSLNFIPCTLIPAGDFVYIKIKVPKPPKPPRP